MLKSVCFVCVFFHSDPKKSQGSFYIQIEPNVTVGAEASKQIIPLDAIRCQTVLSKCLGPLSTWESKLLVSKNSGYNVVHFTPVQVSDDDDFVQDVDFQFQFVNFSLL